jgi:hypothetical protein
MFKNVKSPERSQNGRINACLASGAGRLLPPDAVFRARLAVWAVRRYEILRFSLHPTGRVASSHRLATHRLATITHSAMMSADQAIGGLVRHHAVVTIALFPTSRN